MNALALRRCSVAAQSSSGRGASVSARPSKVASAVPLAIIERRRRGGVAVAAYKITIERDGEASNIEVEEGNNILQAALDAGIELSHDCKMGVCMTCPAKLLSGSVDQSAGMLDEGAIEKGYVLTCVAEPTSDCVLQIIDEDEILEEVLCSSESA